MYRLEDEEEAEDRLFLAGFDRIELRSQERANAELRKKRLAYVAIAVAVLVAVVIIVSLSIGAARKAAEPYTCRDEQGATYDVTFFVIGDWGREGSSDQLQVAKMMADVAHCMPPAFIVSTGDNFYDHGLKSAWDPSFAKSFSSVYSHPSLQENWYAVLGNHDYNDGIDATQNSACAAPTLDSCPADCCYSSVWQYTGRPSMNDIRWHCQNGTYNVPTGNAALLDILMIDTNPFIQRYRDASWGRNAGGIWMQNTSQIKQELQSKLAASQAQWKLVVGHHPIASYGKHCDYAMQADCVEMKWLEAELQAANVAAYMCGHDHDLQYITKLTDPADLGSAAVRPVYIVSGAGSEVRSGEFDKYKQMGAYSMKYMVDDQGFVAVRVNTTHLVIHYYAASRVLPVFSTALTYQQ